jgi:hypothetical protein
MCAVLAVWASIDRRSLQPGTWFAWLGRVNYYMNNRNIVARIRYRAREDEDLFCQAPPPDAGLPIQ